MLGPEGSSMAKKGAGNKRSRPARGRKRSAAGKLQKSASSLEAWKIKDWWDDFSDMGVEKRLGMVREVLQTAAPDGEWCTGVFPDAILKLELGLVPERYAEFFEELLDSRPDVFDKGAIWYLFSAAAACISSDRDDLLERMASRVASVTKKVDDPHFAVISILRLGGHERAAQLVLDAVIPVMRTSGVMPWGINQLIEWSMFEPNQRCTAAGVTEEAIKESYQVVKRLLCDDIKIARRAHRTIVNHWAGKTERTWTLQDFSLPEPNRAGHHVYLLLIDFMRWLSECRGLPPIVSDEFRSILMQCCDAMDGPVTTFLTGLKRGDIEPHLAGKLSFLCLDRIHAPAGVVGMLYLYDFLRERGIVEWAAHKSTASMLNELWKELRQGMDYEWHRYAFLERWLPPAPKARFRPGGTRVGT
jgi:hypothetical protein